MSGAIPPVRYRIDIEAEPLIPFEKSPDHFPEGAKPCRTSLYAWSGPDGANGVILSTVIIAGRRYTSKKAILFFIRQQNPENEQEQPPRRTPQQRRRQAENASKRLREAGF